MNYKLDDIFPARVSRLRPVVCGLALRKADGAETVQRRFERQNEPVLAAQSGLSSWQSGQVFLAIMPGFASFNRMKSEKTAPNWERRLLGG